VAPVSAVTLVNVPPASNATFSNGFFGGIVHGKFKLLRSDTLDYPIYYSVGSSLTVVYNGKAVTVSQLPLKTPIQITLNSGVVVGVRVMGGNE
jgi:hypothetical protein